MKSREEFLESVYDKSEKALRNKTSRRRKLTSLGIEACLVLVIGGVGVFGDISGNEGQQGSAEFETNDGEYYEGLPTARGESGDLEEKSEVNPDVSYNGICLPVAVEITDKDGNTVRYDSSEKIKEAVYRTYRLQDEGKTICVDGSEKKEVEVEYFYRVDFIGFDIVYFVTEEVEYFE